MVNVEINKKLVHTIEKLIASQDWRDGAFLKAAGDKLKHLHKQLKCHLDLGEGSEEMPENILQAACKGEEIYIGLYQAKGDDLDQWLNGLRSIEAQTVNRPIYRTEKEIKTCLRAIENKKAHAYAVAKVDPLDILMSGKQFKKDKFGQELLFVKEKAIQFKNITKFVHVSGQYQVTGKKLVREKDVHFHQETSN